MKKIYPPIGYKFEDDNGVDASDEKAVLDLVLGLSDDQDFQNKASKDTHKHRLDFLQHNGFEFVEEEEENV